MIRRLTLFAAATAAMGLLAACDEPERRPVEVEAPSADDLAIEASADAAAPVETPSATDTPPAPSPGVLPPDQRPSEETVKPESETLFY